MLKLNCSSLSIKWEQQQLLLGNSYKQAQPTISRYLRLHAKRCPSPATYLPASAPPTPVLEKEVKRSVSDALANCFSLLKASPLSPAQELRQRGGKRQGYRQEVAAPPHL